MHTAIAAAEAAEASGVRELLAALPTFVKDPDTVLSVLSLVIATSALLVARTAKNDTRDVRRAERTRAHVLQFRSQSLISKLKWLKANLNRHAQENRCGQNCGLTALNTGKMVKMLDYDGTQRSMGAGDIAKDVLNFFTSVAHDMKRGRLDNEEILEEMSAEIMSTWHILRPHLRHKGVSAYYRYYKRKYSIGSLSRIIEDNSTMKAKLKAIEKRWGRR